MKIYICTLGRPTRQSTLQALLPHNPTLVVQFHEAKLYQQHWPNVPIRVLPPGITTIGKTRQHLLEDEKQYVLMFDDDLTFAVRREDDRTKFRPAEAKDITEMLLGIRLKLDEYAHVGISAREGANRNTKDYLRNTRMMRVLGYDPKILRNNQVRFDRMELMEDFDVTLQLLRKLFPNCLLNNYVHNQAGSNTEGGCSTYRTPERQAAAAHRLAELHPGFVKVVQKQTKTAWGGQERTDVVISWKRAFAG